MTKTAWAHLPNAKHIDAVLADVRKRPEAWEVAWNTVQAEAGYVAQNAAWYAAWTVARDAARYTARDVITALIAWDSAADLLECTPDVLRAMIDLAEPPVCHQAALLLPYAIARSKAKQEVT
jgi:hypothetical protein